MCVELKKGQKRGNFKEWRIRGNRESEAFRRLGGIRKEVFLEKKCMQRFPIYVPNNCRRLLQD